MPWLAFRTNTCHWIMPACSFLRIAGRLCRFWVDGIESSVYPCRDFYPLLAPMEVWSHALSALSWLSQDQGPGPGPRLWVHFIDWGWWFWRVVFPTSHQHDQGREVLFMSPMSPAASGCLRAPLLQWFSLRLIYFSHGFLTAFYVRQLFRLDKWCVKFCMCPLLSCFPDKKEPHIFSATVSGSSHEHQLQAQLRWVVRYLLQTTAHPVTVWGHFKLCLSVSAEAMVWGFVRRPSARRPCRIISEPIGRISFKFQLLLALGHTPRMFLNFWKNKKKKNKKQNKKQLPHFPIFQDFFFHFRSHGTLWEQKLQNATPSSGFWPFSNF